MSWDPNQGAPGSSPDPYGQPPVNPYAQPPQNPYGQPPVYNTAYAAGAAPVASAPLPLSEALRALPQQYIKVLTRPSPQTFAEELPKAAWDIVWVQLLIQALIAALFGFLASLSGSVTQRFLIPTANTSTLPASTTELITLGASIGSIALVPLWFFICAGVFYLLARGFGGQGTFLQQAYTNTLFSVPIGLITSVLSVIPFVGGLLGFAISIYGAVLNIFSIMATHRLSGGKASAVVLIPIGVALLLYCAFVFIVVAVLVAALQRG